MVRIRSLCEHALGQPRDGLLGGIGGSIGPSTGKWFAEAFVDKPKAVQGVRGIDL